MATGRFDASTAGGTPDDITGSARAVVRRKESRRAIEQVVVSWSPVPVDAGTEDQSRHGSRRIGQALVFPAFHTRRGAVPHKGGGAVSTVRPGHRERPSDRRTGAAAPGAARLAEARGGRRGDGDEEGDVRLRALMIRMPGTGASGQSVTAKLRVRALRW
jgi:hypothetical protein